MKEMVLSSLLNNVKVSKIFQTVYGKMVTTHDVIISSLQYDSRRVKRGDMFVAIRGQAYDGHKFIQDAIHNGAKAVVLENDNALPDSFFMHAGVIKIVVSNARKALAEISANYFNHPSSQLTIVGVTGTNGKTTTTHIIKSILEEYEKKSSDSKKVGLIGTIENKIGNEVLESQLTTPESLELNGLLLKVIDKGGSSAVMEVSSHALHQYRVHGINFSAAVFTNLTQDHLDYHRTMEKYFKAKRILFDNLNESAIAISNTDNQYGLRILESCCAKKITYGINSDATVKAKNVNLGISATSFSVIYGREKFQVVTPLIGKFNVYNILAAVATAIGLGIDSVAIQTALKNLLPVRGRFERIESPEGWTSIVDYAHTPDALVKCLLAVRNILSADDSRKGKIITVFGAGGDRDKTKRPKMGKIAADLSDTVIITSDNPRTENPYQIIMDIAFGIDKNTGFLQEIDRRRAIEKAIGMAQKGDVILIAGKGHEEYQIIGVEKIHFSDAEIIRQLISEKK